MSGSPFSTDSAATSSLGEEPKHDRESGQIELPGFDVQAALEILHGDQTDETPARLRTRDEDGPGRAPIATELTTGRIIELSGCSTGPTARTSAAVSWVLTHQALGEPVAWVQPTHGELYPPDLTRAGVDLDALVVVRIPSKEGLLGLTQAAEMLVRSGGFGLVVLDLVGQTGGRRGHGERGAKWQTRLSGLLRKHRARLCVMSDSPAEAPSLGPLVSLRLEPRREPVEVEELAEPGSNLVLDELNAPNLRQTAPRRAFRLRHEVLKDKVGLPEAPESAEMDAPPGLESLEVAPPSPQLSLFGALEVELESAISDTFDSSVEEGHVDPTEESGEQRIPPKRISVPAAAMRIVSNDGRRDDEDAR